MICPMPEYGIWIRGTVGRYHMERQEVVKFHSRDAALRGIETIQHLYFHGENGSRCEVREINPREKIRKSGVIEGTWF